MEMQSRTSSIRAIIEMHLQYPRRSKISRVGLHCQLLYIYCLLLGLNRLRITRLRITRLRITRLRITRLRVGGLGLGGNKSLLLHSNRSNEKSRLQYCIPNLMLKLSDSRDSIHNHFITAGVHIFLHICLIPSMSWYVTTKHYRSSNGL